MSKLSPSFQTLPKWASKVPYPSEWVKVQDPGAGISNRFPGKKIVGRWYLKDEDQYIRDGAEGAKRYFDVMFPHYAECGRELAVIEAVNEPVVKEIGPAQILADFLVEWVTLMHSITLPTAIPAFSMGNPEEWVMGAMRKVMQITEYWTLHEYGPVTIPQDCDNFSLRHEKLVGYMQKWHIRIPPLLITECGIDRGGDGFKHKPGQTPWPEYMNQLLWYEQQLKDNDFVWAAFPFVSGATGSWASFNIGEAEWRDLVKRLR